MNDTAMVNVLADTAAGQLSDDSTYKMLSGLSWVNDLDESREFTEADALAASGDYFMVLATKLDMLAQSLPLDSAEQIEIEHIVTTLFYIEQHYAVVAKSKLR